MFSPHDILGLPKRYRLILGIVTLLSVIHYTGQTAHVIGQLRPSATRYTPGRLGRILEKRYDSVGATGEMSKEQTGWGLFSQSEGPEIFPLLPYEHMHEDDEATEPSNVEKPDGFEDGPDDLQTRWRLKLHRQLSEWDPHPKFSESYDQRDRNDLAARRLLGCLLTPLFPEPLTEGGCSLKTTKIVLGNWGYWTQAFNRGGTSGEHIWVMSLMDAMEQQGYTVMAVASYEGMIMTHAAMPDLVSHIFAEDKFVVTCASDPYCITPQHLQSTASYFPRLQLDTHGDPILTEEMKGWRENDPEKWFWKEGELEGLPVEAERGGRPVGTIPLWKLFCIRWWGTPPRHGYWPALVNFTWNPLGSEWTASPFAYPDHTYLPFSLDRECSAIPLVPYEEKKEQTFVLGKLNQYFHDDNKAPPLSLWPEFQQKTGLKPVSVSVDRWVGGDKEWAGYGVPEGINTIPVMSREDFEREVGLSKVMLGIGSPAISPSVYVSLCQGTPVVMPYFREPGEVRTGYNLFDWEYAQHGPASLIGPPFVYTYQHDRTNTSGIVDLVKKAAETPIERYIPSDMQWDQALKDIDDLMRFDWKRLAERILGSAEYETVPNHRMNIVGRCFYTGRCQPLHPLI